MIAHFRCTLLLQEISPVVLGIDYLQRHGSLISLLTDQLHFTNSSPNNAEQPMNVNRIYHAYTPPMHVPKPYHPHSRNTVPPKPYHVINTAPVTIPARTNTIMTIRCNLPCSRNYLFEPWAQCFEYQPVHCTPVIMLQIAHYLSSLLIIVTVMLHPSTVMSEPWRKSENLTEVP